MKHVRVLAAFVASLTTAATVLAAETAPVLSGREACDKALQSCFCVDY